MSYDLIGRQVGLSYTPGSGGTDIKVAEGVVLSFRVQQTIRDMTPYACNWSDSAVFLSSWIMRIRSTVNSGTGSTNGNPQIPDGVAGSITLLKNSAAASSGKWVGSVLPQLMVLSANAMQVSPQTVEWTLIGKLGITETL